MTQVKANISFLWGLYKRLIISDDGRLGATTFNAYLSKAEHAIFFFSTCSFDALTLLVLLLLQFRSFCWQTVLSLYVIALLSALTYMALTQQQLLLFKIFAVIESALGLSSLLFKQRGTNNNNKKKQQL